MWAVLETVKLRLFNIRYPLPCAIPVNFTRSHEDYRAGGGASLEKPQRNLIACVIADTSDLPEPRGNHRRQHSGFHTWAQTELEARGCSLIRTYICIAHVYFLSYCNITEHRSPGARSRPHTKAVGLCRGVIAALPPPREKKCHQSTACFATGKFKECDMTRTGWPSQLAWWHCPSITSHNFPY